MQGRVSRGSTGYYSPRPPAVDGGAQYMDQRQPVGQQQGLQEGGDGAVHVEADQYQPRQSPQLGRERVEFSLRVAHGTAEQHAPVPIQRAGPVRLLGNVDAYPGCHDHLREPVARRSPGSAGNALQGHERQRAISGRARVVAMRVAQRLGSSTTAR